MDKLILTLIEERFGDLNEKENPFNLLRILGDLLFPEYYACIDMDTNEITIKKPVAYREGDTHVITIYHPIKGWAAVHRYIDQIEGHKYWDVEATGFCGYDTPQEAYRAAMSWSIDEELPLLVMPAEKLDELAKGGGS